MKMQRLETTYENNSAKFLMKSFDYQRQYSHLYAYRLSEMTALLRPRAEAKWGADVPVRKLCDLREEQQEQCIVIGTIFKHQAHKPSILREISEENQLAPQPPRENYATTEDKLILEDEQQRVRLVGNVTARAMTTGAVCAMFGKIEEDGRFVVEETLFYEGGPQKPLSKPREDVAKELVLISGLDQVQVHNFVHSLNLFQHWLAGNLPQRAPKRRELVRLIVAGNSVRTTPEQRVPTLQMHLAEPNDTVESINVLDTWFAAWSETIPIDVMPGAFDPANFMLPQQPFHECMFPLAANNTSFRSVTNPYACTLDETLVLGCSGQNVKDLLRNTLIEEPLEALRSTLTWSHIAPSAPDTLACYPHVDGDPMIIRECPHVYFAGNCDDFATALHTGSEGQRTRLVCVPGFSKTQSVAVVDLETLECREVCFKVAGA